ncbi:MAG: hypothetical protein KBD76_07680 [Bacteriovorax sp.]|nr:hypothetical protein [Bacteriovorax sp.]
MKFFLISMLFSFSSASFATVDANTEVFIVSQHVQTGEFFIQKAPIIGCWGISKGPELAQLTKSYEVSNLGCGDVEAKENINALTCASIVESKESADFSTFSEITLNISNCEEKENKDFIAAIKKVITLNFATKTVKNPKLILVK